MTKDGMGRRSEREMDLADRLSMAQGAFYVATGVWPMVSRRSFEAVTGPKVDWWLVNTVGALVSVVGLTLYRAGREGRTTGEIPLLAMGSAAALATIDVVYVARRRISPVYLLDAAAELVLVGAWGVALTKRALSRST
jgi:hypothetical protein